MPEINSIKIYVKHGLYHVYNRGVNKTSIFYSDKDKDQFIKYLESSAAKYEIDILKYALEKNHFHLIIKQKNERAITGFMRSFCTRYVTYFNNVHERVGHLFQGRYKARLLPDAKSLTRVRNYLEHHDKGEIYESDLLWGIE